jgi:nuclear control of ATPase protein 2
MSNNNDEDDDKFLSISRETPLASPSALRTSPFRNMKSPGSMNQLRYSKSGSFSISQVQQYLYDDENTANNIIELDDSNESFSLPINNNISEGDKRRLEELRWLELDGTISNHALRKLLSEATSDPDLGLHFLKRSILIFCDKVVVSLLNLIGHCESLYGRWESCEQSTSFGLPRYFVEQSPSWWNSAIRSDRSVYQHVENEIEEKLTQIKAIELSVSIVVGKLYGNVKKIESAYDENTLRSELSQTLVFINDLMTDNKQLSKDQKMSTVVDSNKLKIHDIEEIYSNSKMCNCLIQLLDQLPSLESKVTTDLIKYKRAGHFSRFWVHYTIFGIAVLIGTRFLYLHSSYNGKDDLKRWRSMAHSKAIEFMDEHLIIPVQSIYAEFFKKTSVDIKKLTKEVEMNKTTIATMMSELAERKYNDNPDKLNNAKLAIKNLDTEWMLTEHQETTANPWTSLVTGDLIQSLMIQLQKLKLEIDEEMLQMDKLVKANEINLQLAATFPLVFLWGGIIQAFKSFYRWLQRRRFQTLYGRKQPWLHAAAQLRRISRILNTLYEDDDQDLSPQDQGYYLYGLKKIHEIASHELTGGDRRQLLEDLTDLRSETLSSKQKLLVIDRIYRNFPQFTTYSYHYKFGSWVRNILSSLM